MTRSIKVVALRSCDLHPAYGDPLSRPMTAAFDRSIDAVLAEASPADLDLLHPVMHLVYDRDRPAHPVLAALAEANRMPGTAACLLMEQAGGVHRDALMYAAAVDMLQDLPWHDQGEFILDALAAAGYADDARSNRYAPAFYAEQLLARARQRSS
jgi:hypothetical protein